MIELGHYSLLAALALALYAALVSFAGGRRRRADLIRSGENAAYGVFGLVTVAVFALVYLQVTFDFRVEYVASQVTLSLPLFYRVTALWGGQKGSLLLWLWLAVLFGAIASYQNRHKNRELMPYVCSTVMCTAIFFLTILNFVTVVFKTLPNPPADGRGLNPLLHDWGMIIHPPALYLGFVGFGIPFAFAIAALISGKLDSDWIASTRRWTLFSWFFLGNGLLLGGAWAYRELGWGGYWAWDPVENASFMPWLTGTAFLHSVMIQEKRGMLKVWNISLIILTYALTIFGTFLTRSGIITSVHAFANSAFGWVFFGFMVLGLAASFGLLLWRLPLLKSENELESFFSRESAFLLNNVVLVGAAFAVFWGTIFPVISELVKGVKVTVGPPFFNQVNVPIFLALMAIMGVGPLIAWRKATLQNLRKNFTYPLLTALVAFFVFLFFGVREMLVTLALALCVFVLATIWLEFYRGARARRRMSGEGVGAALWDLLTRDKRRYGGYIVHLGVVILFVGVAASSAYQTVEEVRLRQGESFALNGFRLRYEGLRAGGNDLYRAWRAQLTVFREGRRLGVLYPEKRIYFRPEQPTTEAAIRVTPREDLYTVFAEAEEDGTATFKFMLNPLITWVWAGGVVVALGGILCMLPDGWGRRGPRGPGRRAHSSEPPLATGAPAERASSLRPGGRGRAQTGAGG
ncbi:MAG: heme lyase CcmF/NrfE family subunit [Nitrospinota bacterium]